MNQKLNSKPPRDLGTLTINEFRDYMATWNGEGFKFDIIETEQERFDRFLNDHLHDVSS